MKNPQVPDNSMPTSKGAKRGTESSTSSPAKIIFLSGPIGAGKSTVAAAYVASATVPTAYIEGDTFWKHIAKNPGPKPRPRQVISRLVQKSMILAAVPYARGGFETVVDFTTGPWFLPFFKPFVKDIPFDFVMLVPSEGVVEERANGRSEGAEHDKELFEAFDQAGEFERFTLRDDTASVGELVEKLRDGLKEGKYTLDFSAIPDKER
jgi:AAA domain